MAPLSVFVTGARGFIGRHFCFHLERRGFRVTRAVRSSEKAAAGADTVVVGDLAIGEGLEGFLEGHDVVVHLAGRAHISERDAAAASRRFDRDNVAATARVAQAAISAGVRRLVYVSTVGVHGPRSTAPLRESDELRPSGLYARSKLRAEETVWEAAARSNLEVVVLRPTLTYGPHCPGNVARLARLIARPVPLPLGAFEAKRSLIGIDNLTSLLETAATHRAAAGQAILAADGQDLLLADVVRHLAAGMGAPVRLHRVPPAAVVTLARLFGFGADLDKLTSSLTVDIGKAKRLLGWSARVPPEVGLRETGHSFANGMALDSGRAHSR